MSAPSVPVNGYVPPTIDQLAAESRRILALILRLSNLSSDILDTLECDSDDPEWRRDFFDTYRRGVVEAVSLIESKLHKFHTDRLRTMIACGVDEPVAPQVAAA